jgi:hypothetical protein
MLSDKALCYLLITVTCLILACTGCETAAPKADQIQPQQQTVTTEAPQAPAPEVKPTETPLPPEKLPSQPPVAGSVALKFNTGDSATYKVTTEAKQSVKWEGTVPQDFKGGINHNRVEMTYNQQVQSVDENGNAVLKITVEALKYLSMRKDELYMNFDSSNVKDPNDPLALLIGQSYTIEMAPTGEVTKVLELTNAQKAVRRGSRVPRVALRLLRPDTTKQRHSIPFLPDAGNENLAVNDKWSKVRTFSFGLMGAKAYEKIYTFKKVDDSPDGKIANIEMNAIPSTEMAEELHQQQEGENFSERFSSSNDSYNGHLKFNLTNGSIEEYSEELLLEWLAVDSDSKTAAKEPTALKMGVLRTYKLEKIK